jgi:hypothetical protein
VILDPLEVLTIPVAPLLDVTGKIGDGGALIPAVDGECVD